MNDILEYYVMIDNQWLMQNERSLTNDFSQAGAFGSSEAAHEALERIEQPHNIPYVFALLASR